MFEDRLPEGDGAAVSHLRLQTPSYNSSAALHQPGSHQGNTAVSMLLLCVFGAYWHPNPFIMYFECCINICCICVCVNLSLLVSSAIAPGPNVRFSAVLSGSGVRLTFKALPAWTHQLPDWNATFGRAGQGSSRYRHRQASGNLSWSLSRLFLVSAFERRKTEQKYRNALQVTWWCLPSGQRGSIVTCWCCQPQSPARPGPRKPYRWLLSNTWNWKATWTEINTGTKEERNAHQTYSNMLFVSVSTWSRVTTQTFSVMETGSLEKYN